MKETHKWSKRFDEETIHVEPEKLREIEEHEKLI